MKIGIIGLGYVGLPLVIQFAKSGAQVLGIDVDEKKVDALNKGESYISHISNCIFFWSSNIKTFRNIIFYNQFYCSC